MTRLVLSELSLNPPRLVSLSFPTLSNAVKSKPVPPNTLSFKLLRLVAKLESRICESTLSKLPKSESISLIAFTIPVSYTHLTLPTKCWV